MEDLRHQVKASRLLAVYLVLPLSAAVIAADHVFLHGAIRDWLPVRPEVWVVWSMIFGMPHVFGSLHAFADKGYIKHYGARKILAFSGGIALATVALYLENPKLLFFVFLVSIVHHTIAQQTGLAMMLLRTGPRLAYRVWKWSMAASGMAMYYILYQMPIIELRYPLADTLRVAGPFPYMLEAMYGLYGLSVVSGLILLWQASKERKLPAVTIWYALATIAMGGFFLMSMQLRYYAFVVILGRLIHEGSAWFIYLSHDANRQRQSASNAIYNALRFTGLPVPVLSLAMAYSIGMLVDLWSREGAAVAYVFTVAMSLLHYHMESVIWKGTRIHRQYVQFAT